MCKKSIVIKQAEWGQALALRTHLGVLLDTVYAQTDDGQLVGIQPLSIDSGQILLAAASLRALIFDNTGEPLLLSFLEQHNLPLTINSFEGDFAMLFYAQTKTEQAGHLAQFLLPFIVDKKKQEEYPEGENKSIAIIAQEEIPESLKSRFDIWKSADKSALHSMVGLANDDQMMQLCHLTRRHVPIKNWGKLRMGFLKDIPIRRKSVIEYTANKLGGVHYDALHHTKDPQRQNEFRLLSQAYNWEHQAIMHGAIVATAICAIELVTCPLIFEIYSELCNAELKRRNRLLEGGALPK